MTRRKSFEFPVGDRKLVFFERNKEDLDLFAITEKYKAQQFKFIQQNTTDPDDRGMLLMKVLNTKYTPQELSTFMYFSMEGIRQVLWDSYKLGNTKELDREEFLKVIDGHERQIRDLLMKLEGLEDLKKDTGKSVELSREYADALLVKVYGISLEELGKLSQRQYTDLLENLAGTISFEQVGKVHDVKAEEEKDRKNLDWVRKLKKEKGIVN